VTVPVPLVPDLPAIAGRLLALAVAAVPSPPARQFRSAGTEAWDAEQLTVRAGPMSPGFPGGTATGQYELPNSRQRQIMFTVELVRCVPAPGNDGTPPTMAALDAAGARQMADWNALDMMVRHIGWGSQIDDAALTAAGVKSVAPGVLAVVGPEGGMVAVTCNVILTI